jgi:hypothetical protein
LGLSGICGQFPTNHTEDHPFKGVVLSPGRPRRTGERNGYPYFNPCVRLELVTHCPTKWVLRDEENDRQYRGSPSGRWDPERGEATHG